MMRIDVSFGKWLAAKLQDPQAAAEYERAKVELAEELGSYNLTFSVQGVSVDAYTGTSGYATEAVPIVGQHQFSIAGESARVLA
jgi:hypothetical protein